MKRAKKLTRAHKILLSNRGYDPEKYLFLRALQNSVIFVARATGEHLVVEWDL